MQKITEEDVLDLLSDKPLTQSDIAKELKTHRGTPKRHLDRLQEKGLASLTGEGWVKVAQQGSLKEPVATKKPQKKVATKKSQKRNTKQEVKGNELVSSPVGQSPEKEVISDDSHSVIQRLPDILQHAREVQVNTLVTLLNELESLTPDSDVTSLEQASKRFQLISSSCESIEKMKETLDNKSTSTSTEHNNRTTTKGTPAQTHPDYEPKITVEKTVQVVESQVGAMYYCRNGDDGRLTCNDIVDEEEEEIEYSLNYAILEASDYASYGKNENPAIFAQELSARNACVRALAETWTYVHAIVEGHDLFAKQHEQDKEKRE